MYINLFLILAVLPAGGHTNIGMPAVVPFLQDSGSLAGRVVEKGTDLALAGVIVRWKGTSHSVLTDAEGRYRISVHCCINKLVFSKPGWDDKTIRVRRYRKKDISLKKLEKQPAPPQPVEDLPPDSIPDFIN